jgi:hypothetical protein
MSAPRAAGPVVPAVVWVPCPTCWGQRRILELVAVGNGDGNRLVARSCPGCLGVGEVLRS